jgi:hypothetical protein
MSKKNDDEETRRTRAEELRADIARRSSGATPPRPQTPREMTDEAARKAWEEEQAKKDRAGTDKPK